MPTGHVSVELRRQRSENVGGEMFPRRVFVVSGLTLLPFCYPVPGSAQSEERFTVRIRADETVRGVLSPVVLQGLTITPDQSAVGRDMANHAPSGRGGPVIFIIVGTLALSYIMKLVNEMIRQLHYGGIVIDGRKSPPEISNDLKIPANMIFVIQGDGTVKQFRSVEELPTETVSSVLRGRK